MDIRLPNPDELNIMLATKPAARDRLLFAVVREEQAILVVRGDGAAFRIPDQALLDDPQRALGSEPEPQAASVGDFGLSLALGDRDEWGSDSLFARLDPAYAQVELVNMLPEHRAEFAAAWAMPVAGAMCVHRPGGTYLDTLADLGALRP